MAAAFTVTGVIIKRSNYKEADKWLTLLTREKGKIKVLAKGLRKLSTKRGGKLELFNLVRLQVVPGKAYLVATEVETTATFPVFKNNLAKVSLVYLFAEVIDILAADDQLNILALDLFGNFLFQAEKLDYLNLQKLLVASLGLLLQELGFWDGQYLKDQMQDLNFLQSYIENITEKRLRSIDVLSEPLTN